MKNKTDFYFEIIDTTSVTGRDSVTLALSITETGETIAHASEQCLTTTPCFKRIKQRMFLETHFATLRKPRSITTNTITAELFPEIEQLCQDWDIDLNIMSDPDFNETCMKSRLARFQQIPKGFAYTLDIAGAGEGKFKIEPLPWSIVNPFGGE